MELLLFTLHTSDLLIFIMRMCYFYNSLNIYKNRRVATEFSGKSILNCFPKRLFRKPKVGVMEAFLFYFGRGWSVYIVKPERGFFHTLFEKHTCIACRCGLRGT